MAAWEQRSELPQLQCWFCQQPAVTIGYGFAVCAGRPDGELNCSEKATRLATGVEFE